MTLLARMRAGTAVSGWLAKFGALPRRLRDARQLTGVCHFAEANSAQTELPVHRMRASASVAPRVAAHRELRLAIGLLNKRRFRHCLVLLEREAEQPAQRAALVVGDGRSDQGDVHTTRTVDPVDINLMEH